MVKVRNNLTGRTFGRLTVIKQVDDYIYPDNIHKVAQYLCECSCEKHTQIIVRSNSLISGNTRSCGCIQKESISNIGANNKKYNTYDLSGEYGIGFAINTNKEFYFDLEDYDKIKDYCWYENVLDGFHLLQAHEQGTDKTYRMHSLLGFINYDHINRNELDNRKCNLRPCTTQENGRNKSIRRDNTSGIIGVNWYQKYNKWVARIQIDKHVRKHLGYFDNKNDAIVARLKAEQEYFGEFAPQKHLYEQYGIAIIQTK